MSSLDILSGRNKTKNKTSISSLLSSLNTLHQTAIQNESQQLLSTNQRNRSARNGLLHTGAPPPPVSSQNPPISFRTGRRLWKESAPSSGKQGKSSSSSSNTQTVATTNDQWYYMRSTPMTPELKMDLQILQNRNYFDPKRFYKSSSLDKKKNIGVVQVGTVITEGSNDGNSRSTTASRYNSNSNTNHPAESGRATKNTSFIQEIMKDTKIHSYTTKKYKTMQQTSTVKKQQQQPHRKKKPVMVKHKK